MRAIERLAQREHAGERQDAEVERRARNEAVETQGKCATLKAPTPYLAPCGNHVEPGVEREQSKDEAQNQIGPGQRPRLRTNTAPMASSRGRPDGFVRPLAAASKAVLTDASLIIAVIDELDLQDTLRLALLLKERSHHRAPIPTHVVDPISMDELLDRDRLALALRPFEGCARLARPGRVRIQ